MKKLLYRAVGAGERLLIIIVAAMGVTGNANIAYCALAWAAIIAGAEIARIAISINIIIERKNAERVYAPVGRK